MDVIGVKVIQYGLWQYCLDEFKDCKFLGMSESEYFANRLPLFSPAKILSEERKEILKNLYDLSTI